MKPASQWAMKNNEFLLIKMAVTNLYYTSKRPMSFYSTTEITL
jgi:hypothetical protein